MRPAARRPPQRPRPLDHGLLGGDRHGRELLREVAHLEAHDGLEEPGAVVGPRRVRVLEHLLRDLAVELGARVAEVRLHVDELLELVELAVHLHDGHLLAVPRVRAVEELDARVRARELAAARDPADGRALVVQVHGVKELDALLLDHAHAQDLALVVVRDELRGQHLEDDVAHLLLRVDVRVKVGLARLDGRLDRLEGVAALGHVALDLPRELDVVGDVEVDLEVVHVAHALVVEGVQALHDEDLGGGDLLRRVEEAGHVVVDRLLDGLALHQVLHLAVHVVEVLGLRRERGDVVVLAPLAVAAVVVVQADDSGGVGDEGVGVRVAALRGGRVAAHQGRHAAHEGGLAAAGVRRQADEDWAVQCNSGGNHPGCGAGGGAGRREAGAAHGAGLGRHLV
mmetsp:Transcript_5430/g.18886  ORF Transcript_5430/g.18886 Transcript_5430/m.18886 type:complete len:398 (-) Transcript_5430:65-1258(-)